MNQRLIGTFGFSDVGRSFDGVHYAYATASSNFTFVGGGADARRVSGRRLGLEPRRLRLRLLHARMGPRRAHAADTRVFAIEYDDFRHILKTDNRPLAVRQGDLDNIRINTFGGHTLHAFETGAGTLDLLLWGAAQTGRWGVQQQRAGAVDVEGGFQPKILPKLKPWLRGGLFLGLGRRQPERQHARHVLPDSAHAAALRAISVLQHDEQRRHVRDADSAAASQSDHLERISRPAAQRAPTISGTAAAESFSPGPSAIPAAPLRAGGRSAISMTPMWNIG